MVLTLPEVSPFPPPRMLAGTSEPAAAREPYVLLSWRNEQAEIDGTAACSLGRVLEVPGRSQPDGVFAQWGWDGRTLRVRNDRYGMQPLYYFESPGRLAVSPSVSTLLRLGASADLDEPAFAVFLRLGFFLGEETPFRAIRAMPPDATLVWSAGRLQIAGRRVVCQAQPLSRNQAIDGYIHLFRRAIARRLPPSDTHAVPLSGGRDSRHILFELCAAGHRPAFCVTARYFPPRSSDEAGIARAVAEAVGVPHVVLDQPRSRLRAELAKNRITGFCADEHSWYLAVADYLQGRARSIHDGIGGDVLSAGLFLTGERLALYTAGRFEELATRLFVYSESHIEHLVAADLASALSRDRAIAHLAVELRAHADAPNPVGSFYFWNRTRREIALAAYRILGANAEVLSPYLDHELYEFLASLPASLLLDHTLHTDTIRRAYPRYRELPFEDKGAPPAQDPSYARRFSCELAVYALAMWRRRRAMGIARSGTLCLRALRRGLTGDPNRLEWLMPALAVYLLQLADETHARRCVVS